ncbi:helix-turn-helix domain-containing protein [Paenibacillus sp. B1-33]|uniref:helix-turn-helix domain-containing protein n=1 Tax=unclassified Paenibacillus TaxID=185978 RepID=UPI003D2BCF1B
MTKSIQERLIELSLNEEWHNFFCPFQQNMYYIPYPHMIRKCYGLSINERNVLLDILCHLGENEVAFPPLETIACNLGISESTVKSAITSLEEKGFIKTVRKRGHVNRYRIDQLESNPYIALSETVHYFLKNYQPKSVNKSLVRSVISTIINGDSYDAYANRIRKAYTSTDEFFPDVLYDTLSALMMEIRGKLKDEKDTEVSLPIYSDYCHYFNLYLESIGFDDGDEYDWEEFLNTENEEDSTQDQ